MTVSTANLTLEVDLRRTSTSEVIRNLEKRWGVHVNILRGRMTPERSWLALELAGTPRAVHAALRVSQERTA